MSRRVEIRLKGIPISGGVAVAKVCLFNEERHSAVIPERISMRDAKDESARLAKAVQVVTKGLDKLRQRVARTIGGAEAEVFTAQKMILEDRRLRKRMSEAVDHGYLNAEGAVIKVLDAYENRMKEVDSEYLKERATDIGELKRRLLDVLGDISPSLRCEGQEHCERGRHRIVVARDLTPSLTVELDVDALRGFATERGGATSHAAILARALNIPAVSGLKDIYSRLSCGTELLVNGNTGEVVVWPSERTMAEYEKARAAEPRVAEVVPPVPQLKVMANISLSTDVDEAIRMKADGIGLYRTEYEFLAAGRVLNEDEQFVRYGSVVKAMKGKPVHIRLLDIGGDKGAPFLGLAAEPNPSLGYRGSRLLLGQPELLRTQARALARASAHGEIRVLYPMIVDLDQFISLRDAVRKATAGFSRCRLKHGVMFEVPSAAMQARAILDVADFGSIGTNDLIQYLFAVDRNNERVSADIRPDHPVLWAVIRDIVRAGRLTGKPVSLCGEIGASADAVSRLVRCGIGSVSASTRMIPKIRQRAAGLRPLTGTA